MRSVMCRLVPRFFAASQLQRGSDSDSIKNLDALWTTCNRVPINLAFAVPV